MPDITPEQVAALLDGITEPPWVAEYSGEQGDCVIPHDAESTREAVCVTRLYAQSGDAEFIAAAPDIARAYLAEHERAEQLAGFRRDLMAVLPYSDEDVETSLVVAAERLQAQVERVKAQIAEEMTHGPVATYYALRFRAALAEPTEPEHNHDALGTYGNCPACATVPAEPTEESDHA